MNGVSRYAWRVTAVLIGYARCSTAEHDLETNRQILLDLGVSAEHIYLDRGYSGAKRPRPGLDLALAAVRPGGTLVVPKLDRLARSVPDARQIADSLASRRVRLQLGATIHDPTDPLGKAFFDIVATFAEFEADLVRLRTREGMAVAKAQGKLKGRAPKLSAPRQAHLLALHAAGEHTIAELADLFAVSRPTVYRVLDRAAASAAPAPEGE
jgi:DNA invertase Pin-like site-specific DNA recombinase